ncbi:50S ribosomal protein L6 [Mycoplasma elephantis]|uniref:50S ribosomal protein L6 n=1 Tax=Mycoplasma elephantis TaxID=114882 RepID=UPI0004883E8F|nr:50S ribosomal protein L6 [Mycoplasma elephantis]
MSRVGNRILTIPAGVEITNNNNFVVVKGPKGELSRQFSNLITIDVNNNQLSTKRSNEEKHTKQLHGTTNSLLSSMLIGVTKGFKKELVLKGVGYKMTLKGNQIEILVGYSHPVLLEIPSNLKVELPKPLEVTVSGIDKQAVGEFAAKLRKVRTPNPYSGKGMAYKDEVIKIKEGKTASK